MELITVLPGLKLKLGFEKLASQVVPVYGTEGMALEIDAISAEENLSAVERVMIGEPMRLAVPVVGAVEELKKLTLIGFDNEFTSEKLGFGIKLRKL